MHGKAVHGSDNWRETEPLLELLLRAPGRLFLNASPYEAGRSLLSKLNEVQSSVGEGQAETINIAGSSVLELHGLRKARDVHCFTPFAIPAKNQFDWGAETWIIDREASGPCIVPRILLYTWTGSAKGSLTTPSFKGIGNLQIKDEQTCDWQRNSLGVKTSKRNHV